MPRGGVPDPKSSKRGTSHRKPKEARTLAPVEKVSSAIDPPADLNPLAAELWRDVVRELASHGASREVDAVHVRFLCDQFVTYQECQAVVTQFGPMVEVEGRYVENPAVAMRDKAQANYLKISDRLGLDPLSRLKLGLLQVTGQSILAGIDKELGIQVKT